MQYGDHFTWQLSFEGDLLGGIRGDFTGQIYQSDYSDDLYCVLEAEHVSKTCYRPTMFKALKWFEETVDQLRQVEAEKRQAVR